MLSSWAVLVFGLFLGMRHALDADHVVAISIIVSKTKSVRKAAWIGAAWGLGHTLTVGAAGAAIVLFGFAISPLLNMSLELAVAAMLIALGAWNLRSLFRSAAPAGEVALAAHAEAHAPTRAHTHVHSHGDYVHTHPHSHAPEAHGHAPEATPLARLDHLFGGARPYRLLRPLAVGMVHGLAGSAALALLVLPAIPQASWALAYLVVFGAGTVLGMMAVTSVLALPFASRRPQLAWVGRSLAVAASLAGIAFGLFLAYGVTR